MASPLLVPTPLVVADYSELVMRISVEDKTHICAIAITGYVSIAAAIFLINTEDGAYLSSYTGSNQLDSLSGGLLFWLQSKIVDVLKFFALAKFEVQIETGSVLTA